MCVYVCVCGVGIYGCRLTSRWTCVRAELCCSYRSSVVGRWRQVLLRRGVMRGDEQEQRVAVCLILFGPLAQPEVAGVMEAPTDPLLSRALVKAGCLLLLNGNDTRDAICDILPLRPHACLTRRRPGGGAQPQVYKQCPPPSRTVEILFYYACFGPGEVEIKRGPAGSGAQGRGAGGTAIASLPALVHHVVRGRTSKSLPAS